MQRAAEAEVKPPSVPKGCAPLPKGSRPPKRDSGQRMQDQGTCRSSPRPVAAAPQVKTGSLRLRTGWWWSRRHFELRAGHLRWWRRQEDHEKEVDPLGEISLVQGEIRWRVEYVGGSRLELVCHRGASRGGNVERCMLEADDLRDASDWAEAIGQHIRYVDMLLCWPLPLEGRQGDVRSYGITYPEGVS